MARPKVCADPQRIPLCTDPPRTLRRAEGLQATATALRPCTGSVKENDNQGSQKTSTVPVVQGLKSPRRTQPPAVQVETEQNCSPALGEKPLPETPVSATIFYTFPGAEGLQATAPAMWPGTQRPEENYGEDIGRLSIATVIQRRELQALVEKTKQNRSPASASIATAAVVNVEGVDAGTCSLMPNSSGDSQGMSVSKKRKGERKASTGGKKPRAARVTLSFADLVSDAHMRLKDKADKLGVSMSLFKKRRIDAGLGRWPGRGVRAEMKRAQAQARE